ncbi:hypothetical protein N7510_009926 [Penicillium lagena]|uniref:uncharacterized protein n=1 Tax=Penicillium lagena TaxID=94218 RepID=UPI0025416EFB|nr:uncharacterized protein N7510_009926 [Penicillium lagena]KAJ5604772.1 hypothetical protein N7510_009926 [Penicillium lagena]
MSFLDSILSSIQTDKPSSASLSQPPAPPAPSSTAKNNERKLAPTASRDIPVRGNVDTGTKRKAEEQLPRPTKPSSQAPSRPTAPRPTVSPAASKSVPNPISKPAAASQAPKPAASRNGASAIAKTAPAKPAPAKPAPARPAPVKAIPAAPSKVPPKGSFADIMAQAKTLQQKAPTQAGMFRHQAVPKERLSKLERKKRIMEAQAKEKEQARLVKKGVPIAAKGKADGKRAEREEVSYKGTAKQSRLPEPPTYRGTAGMSVARGAHDRKRYGRRSRADEYLGTDEEDEGDYGGYEDEWSDASSDMEAGLNDVEQEEAAALRSARREDEEEQRAEQEAKKAKLERQKKLAALVRNKR